MVLVLSFSTAAAVWRCAHTGQHMLLSGATDPSQVPLRRCVQHHALQGRFSGRLARKEDEAQLVVECALLGPLLGDTQPAT